MYKGFISTCFHVKSQNLSAFEKKGTFQTTARHDATLSNSFIYQLVHNRVVLREY
jgi:hypothetical protein